MSPAFRKSRRCDGCRRERSDVRSVGRDSNGEPDAPSMCFLCRKEAERGRAFHPASGHYVSVRLIDAETSP